jgi:cellulose biosynthesis protein BcsQ
MHTSVLAIVNGKGGCGKTSCAANLAAIWATQDRRVLAVDLDAQGNLAVDLGVEDTDAKKLDVPEMLQQDTLCALGTYIGRARFQVDGGSVETVTGVTVSWEDHDRSRGPRLSAGCRVAGAFPAGL